MAKERLYPKHTLDVIQKLLRVYRAVARGQKPKEWLCLCNHIQGSKMNTCVSCPVDKTACVGPGGDWWLVSGFVEYEDLEKINKKVIAQASKKAEAWAKWLRRQREMYKAKYGRK